MRREETLRAGFESYPELGLLSIATKHFGTNNLFRYIRLKRY